MDQVRRWCPQSPGTLSTTARVKTPARGYLAYVCKLGIDRASAAASTDAEWLAPTLGPVGSQLPTSLFPLNRFWSLWSEIIVNTTPPSNRSFSRVEFCRLLAECLSRCWLNEESSVQQRIEIATGLRGAWLADLSQAVCARYQPMGGYARCVELSVWLGKQPAIRRFFRGKRIRLLPVDVCDRLTRAAARRAGWTWQVPELDSLEELCHLLELRSFSTLDWLVLPHRRRDLPTLHYRQHPLAKRQGGVRWLEEPLPMLKAVQRRILESILPGIPVHPAAHAFRTGLSAITCARQHVGQRMVLRMDLRDFFSSISTGRVQALFRTAGYTATIAQQLAWLCTAPASLTELSEERRVLSHSRLPQGAPTSPAIANAIAFRLDRRLNGLAKHLGAHYTRYADDLIFSGGENFACRAERFATSAAAIAMEEGFSVQFRKTKRLASVGEQRILGITVNQKLNLNRRDFEKLKAELNNCVQHGWRSQNRRQLSEYAAHLRGRIALVQSLNGPRGEKLMQLYRRIEW